MDESRWNALPDFAADRWSRMTPAARSAAWLKVLGLVAGDPTLDGSVPGRTRKDREQWLWTRWSGLTPLGRWLEESPPIEDVIDRLCRPDLETLALRFHVREALIRPEPTDPWMPPVEYLTHLYRRWLWTLHSMVSDA